MAALVALVGSALGAALLDRPPPLEPLAALIMEWTPVPMANWLLDVLGPVGKPLALFGAAAMALAVAGMLGRLATSQRTGRAGGALAVLVSALLVVPLWTANSRFGLVSLIGGFWVWFWLHGRREATDEKAPLVDERIDGRRRGLLIGATNVGVLAAVSLLPMFAFALRVRLVGRTARPPLFEYTPPGPRQPRFSLSGLTPEITPLPAFYVMSKNVADPVLDAATWRLAVHGQVRRTLSLTLDDLVGMPRTDQHVTMQCVSNPVGGPLWSATCFSGVVLADLLARVEPLSAAAWVTFEGQDGHREQLPLDRALDPGVLLAYWMAGDWLTPEHGFPVRLLVPGLYGFRSVKWLTRIEVLGEPRAGHWEERAWTAAAIHSTARVDLVQRTADGTVAAGVAFAGSRGISAVEVRLDGGPWRPTSLHVPPLGPVMWVQWRTVLEAPAGREVRAEARAIDGASVPQVETPRGQFPGGATGLHGLTVRL